MGVRRRSGDILVDIPADRWSARKFYYAYLCARRSRVHRVSSRFSLDFDSVGPSLSVDIT